MADQQNVPNSCWPQLDYGNFGRFDIPVHPRSIAPNVLGEFRITDSTLGQPVSNTWLHTEQVEGEEWIGYANVHDEVITIWAYAYKDFGNAQNPWTFSYIQLLMKEQDDEFREGFTTLECELFYYRFRAPSGWNRTPVYARYPEAGWSSGTFFINEGEKTNPESTFHSVSMALDTIPYEGFRTYPIRIPVPPPGYPWGPPPPPWERSYDDVGTSEPPHGVI